MKLIFVLSIAIVATSLVGCAVVPAYPAYSEPGYYYSAPYYGPYYGLYYGPSFGPRYGYGRRGYGHRGRR